MPFVLTVLVLAVLLSYPRGGRLRSVSHAPLRWSGLLFVGVLLQVGVDIGAARGWFEGADTASWALLLLSQLLVVGWVAGNWELPGMVLVMLGLGLNAVVMAANGAMPVDPEAIRLLGLGGAAVPPGKHTLLTDATRLPWLADVWALPPLRSIISIGDVVLAAGLIPLMHALMTYRPAPQRRGRARRSEVSDPGRG